MTEADQLFVKSSEKKMSREAKKTKMELPCKTRQNPTKATTKLLENQIFGWWGPNLLIRQAFSQNGEAAGSRDLSIAYLDFLGFAVFSTVLDGSYIVSAFDMHPKAFLEFCFGIFVSVAFQTIIQPEFSMAYAEIRFLISQIIITFSEREID